MHSKKILVLMCLVTIAFFGALIRLVGLDKNPNGLYVDEASTGYNAWSLATTGKDEYGKEFPLAMRFLGSYTPPLYTYTTSQVISLLGLSVFSVRLTSAIAGILLIPLIFVLAKSLNFTNNNLTLLFAPAFMAISPWAIYYSRIGYETNFAFFIYSLGVLFLWWGIKNNISLVTGIGLLSLSTNAYHAERLLVPLSLFIYFLIFRKELISKKRIKILFLAGIVSLLVVFPQLLILTSPANTVRGLGLFYHQALINQVEKMDILPQVITYPLSFFREFFSQYLAYYSPRNLFFEPDPDTQRSLPELSTFYPWMIFLYFVGLIELFKSIKEKSTKFILLIFFTSAVPASLTGDPFSTQRALPLLLPSILVMTTGVDKLLQNSFKKYILVCLVILSTFSLFYLYRSYAVLLPNERAKFWGFGYQKLAEEISKRPNEKFLIDSGRIKPAYIELAFYLKYPPLEFQQVVDSKIKDSYYQNVNWNGDLTFGQVQTRAIKWEEDIYKDQILVGDEFAVSGSQANEHFLVKVFEIKSPADEILFVGFRTNPAEKCRSGWNYLCRDKLYE